MLLSKVMRQKDDEYAFDCMYEWLYIHTIQRIPKGILETSPALVRFSY